MKRFAERVGSFSIFSNGSWTIERSLSIVTVLPMVNKVKARKEAAAVKILLI